ncbi:MAG TPA: hypothetical protein VIM29_11645 [Bacillota bacterium]
MLRKFTKTKTVYPSDDAVKKSVFLLVQEITKKWSMPVRDCIIIGQLMISLPTGWMSDTPVKAGF